MRGPLVTGLALAVAGCVVAVAPSQAAPETATSAFGTARVAVTTAAQAAPAATTPNIVLVMADDMRADDLVFTPRVRRLIAAHGTTFANSFSPFPLCCPARASFLTGAYAHNHGVLWHNKPYGYGAFDDSKTIATSMKAAGYRTGYIGKYLNRYGPDRSLVGGGPSYRYVPRGWDDWRATVDANPHVRGGTYNYLSTPFNVNGRVDQSHAGEYQTDVVGRFARGMATRMSRRSQPFFMMVNFLAPHTGGPAERDDPGVVLDDRGKRQRFETPARPGWVRGRFDGLVDRGQGMPRGGGPSERRIADQPSYFSSQPEPNRRERAALREVTRQRAESMFVMDREVGRLVARLKKLGEWDDTVLAFTSDNGYYLGEHRHRTGKVLAHDPSYRVPLLVTGPGLRDERTTYDPVSTVDLTATLLDLADAAPPLPADGRSLAPTLAGQDEGWRYPMLYEAIYTGRSRASAGFGDARSSIGVRTAQWYYVRNHEGKDMLYDMSRDPLQNRNLAGKAAYAPVVEQLDAVWAAVKDCRGSTCLAALPDALVTGPDAAAALGAFYWKRQSRVYGFRPGTAKGR